MSLPTSFSDAFPVFFGAALGWYLGNAAVTTAAFWGSRALTYAIHWREIQAFKAAEIAARTTAPPPAARHGDYL